MGSLVEAFIAAMGLAAGVMVFFTTLRSGESFGQTEEQTSHQPPRTIHPDGGRIAA